MSHRGRCRKSRAGIVVCLLILFLLIPVVATADGMAFRYGPSSSLAPLGVHEQRAIILHKDGVQRMFIAINLQEPPSAEDSASAAVWIFPVPGTLDRADVEVTAFMPELKGKDVEQAFKDAMQIAPLIPLATQPHFLPIALFGALIGLSPHGTRYLGMPQGAVPGVTTHKEVDTWGIHAELITADSVASLAAYLRTKQVGVVEERLSTFTPYLSDKYVLVVAWISSYEELIKRFPQYREKQGGKRPSLYVEFPSDKPFYPMRPTAGYGKNKVTVSLYIVGFMESDMSSGTPSEQASMRPYVRYYAGEKEAFDRSYRALLSAQEKNLAGTTDKETLVRQRKTIDKFLSAVPEGEIPFTRVSIGGPAENFTQDLRFAPRWRVHVMHFIGSSLWGQALLVILLLAAVSYVSAGISGLLAFRQWKPWARLGLWNFFTIVALVIATWLKRRDPDHEAKRVTVSGRWEALVFGAVISVPLTFCVGILLSGITGPVGWGRQFLSYALIVAGLLISARIAAAVGWNGHAAIDGHPEGKASRTLAGKKETLVRVVLMCIPAIFVSLAYYFPLILFLLFDDEHVAVARSTLKSGLPVAGLFVALPVLITLGLFAVSWMARVAGSALRSRSDPKIEDRRALLPDRKPEAWMLVVLTCTPLAFLLLYLFPYAQSKSAPLHRVAWLGLTTVELLIATWVVWSGSSARIPAGRRISPVWSITIAVFVPLVAVCGIVAFGPSYLKNVGSVFYSPDLLDISDTFLAAAATLAGVMAIIGLLARRRLIRILRDMTYKTALSPIFCTMAASSYLAVLALLGSTLLLREATVGTILATMAIVLGTWIVKLVLDEPPTKALRFGVIFSFVFTILSLGAIVAVYWMLKSSGV